MHFVILCGEAINPHAFNSEGAIGPVTLLPSLIQVLFANHFFEIVDPGGLGHDNLKICRGGVVQDIVLRGL